MAAPAGDVGPVPGQQLTAFGRPPSSPAGAAEEKGVRRGLRGPPAPLEPRQRPCCALARRHCPRPQPGRPGDRVNPLPPLPRPLTSTRGSSRLRPHPAVKLQRVSGASLLETLVSCSNSHFALSLLWNLSDLRSNLVRPFHTLIFRSHMVLWQLPGSGAPLLPSFTEGKPQMTGCRKALPS